MFSTARKILAKSLFRKGFVLLCTFSAKLSINGAFARSMSCSDERKYQMAIDNLCCLIYNKNDKYFIMERIFQNDVQH